jgi:hypothetical protein
MVWFSVILHRAKEGGSLMKHGEYIVPVFVILAVVVVWLLWPFLFPPH